MPAATKEEAWDKIWQIVIGGPPVAKTKVVHQRDGYDVDITRRGKWGNPFVVGRDGNRATVIAKYEMYITQGTGQHLIEALPELRGKRLGCLCKPKTCHGDVLVRLMKERGLV